MQNSNLQEEHKIIALNQLISDLESLRIEFSNLGLDSFNLESPPFWSKVVFVKCLSILNTINRKLIDLKPALTFRERAFAVAYPSLSFFRLTWILPAARQEYYWKQFLSDIHTSIQTMTDNLENFRTKWIISSNVTLSLMKKYQRYTQFLMQQSLVPGFGSSRGECYGLTFDYALYRRRKSPQPFKFTAEAAWMQERQNIKNPQDQLLFPKRLSPVRYQPDLLKQAQGLSDYAKQNQGKQLLCTLIMTQGAHAIYLEYTKDAKWHFLDPNFGAFELNQEDDFKLFYRDLYSNLIPWHSYLVEELLSVPSVNTWAGKIRSILTGPRYAQGFETENFLAKVFIGLGGVILGGAFIYLSPIILPGIFILAIGAMGGISAYCFGVILMNKIRSEGFSGLLALPRFLHHTFYSALKKLPQNVQVQHNEQLEMEDSYSQIFYSLPNKKVLDVEHKIDESNIITDSFYNEQKDSAPEIISACEDLQDSSYRFS